MAATAVLQASESMSLLPTFVWDEAPAFYGRYRLWFAQVGPRTDEHLPVRSGMRAAAQQLLAEFAAIARLRVDSLLHWQDSGDGAIATEMIADVCYIDMRNLWCALQRLAPLLVDAHFFVYSSGDGDDRFVDELRIVDGTLIVVRHTAQQPAPLRAFARSLHFRAHDSRLQLYAELLDAPQRPPHHATPAFRNFVARQYLQEADWRLHAADRRSKHYGAAVGSARRLVQQAIAIDADVDGAPALLARCASA
ncbi:MAG TPA: hypothetical protein PLF40_10995 [Kofleriaceae bacterium]|nr:hypothetical protein [Kofleriaceae bacterium]